MYVKNRIGNGEAKERTSMTHGHKLSGGIAGGKGVPGGGTLQGKIWDKYNNNKIYLKNKSIFIHK